MNRADRRKAGWRAGRPPLVVRAPDGSQAVSPFFTGMELPICAWDDCASMAFERHHLIEPDPEKQANVWFFFCTPQHRDLHKHSHRSYARAEPGRSGNRFL